MVVAIIFNTRLFALFNSFCRIYHTLPLPRPLPFAIIWATYFLSACRRLLIMIVDRASYKWAYSEDIPGSRCGPEDGPWPRSYQVLTEKDLWRELRILAKPQSLKLDPQAKYKADSINFQPSPTTKTQDRYVVTQLEVHDRLWTFTGVFDGTCHLPNSEQKPLTDKTWHSLHPFCAFHCFSSG